MAHPFPRGSPDLPGGLAAFGSGEPHAWRRRAVHKGSTHLSFRSLRAVQHVSSC